MVPARPKVVIDLYQADLNLYMSAFHRRDTGWTAVDHQRSFASARNNACRCPCADLARDRRSSRLRYGVGKTVSANSLLLKPLKSGDPHAEKRARI
jgi:hypothetical protein